MRYLDVLGGRGDLNGVPFGANAPDPLSFGQVFMQDCANAGLAPPGHITQICQHLHDDLRTRNWIWDPGAPGNGYIAGARLLDGTTNRGECAFVPYALAYLLNAPAPWGWGVGGATVETYDGLLVGTARHGVGFISVHLPPHLAGPMPNITRPNGQTLPGYYMWGNHKVVLFNGRRYDVCYRAEYANLSDMAAAWLTTVRAAVSLKDLRAYSPRTWSGLAGLVGMTISNIYWWTTHQIAAYQAAGPDHNVTGYYLSWVQEWKTFRGPRGSVDWYGPYGANPLA